MAKFSESTNQERKKLSLPTVSAEKHTLTVT